MQLVNLPIDVWFAIMEHLSLAELAHLYTAFASSTTPVDVSVIKQFAVNVISRMVAVNKCRFVPGFSNHSSSPELRLTHSHPGEPWHQDTLFSARYDPNFSDTMEFSRAFRAGTQDPATTDMTLFANDGKPFNSRSMRPIVHDSENTGPTELTSGYIDFRSTSTPTDFLRFTLSALEADIKETFSDVLHSPICVRRTIAHVIPVVKVQWVERDKETRFLDITPLPKEWYEFWSASEIQGVSTFSKQLITFTHYLSGEVIQEWRWKMESFKTEWKIPMSIPGLSVSTSLQ